MYSTTANKPTAVTHSLVGNFTGPDDLNLITAKTTQIEIHSIGEEGLTPLLDVGIYGRIECIRIFRPSNEDQDLIFLTTERKMFSILWYDKKNGQIVTRANGDIKDRTGRLSDSSRTAIIDPERRCIGLHLYDGVFKIIPMNPQTGHLSEAYNVRLDQIDVLNIEFLSGCDKPTIGVLYQDIAEQRNLIVYQVDASDQKLVRKWDQEKIDPGASFLIPYQEGFVVVGDSSFTWLNGKGFSSINTPRPTVFKTWTMIDQNRVLLGDIHGQLFLLQLENSKDNSNNNNNSKGGSSLKMRLVPLGETSIPSSLSYLDNGVVFLGSKTGDSQLLKLETNEKSESQIEVLDTYTNIGPIVDSAVVDLERHGQCQLVTCSGAFKDGSLRVIRNGVGIQEQAKVDLEGIKGLWSLRPDSKAEYDQFIVFSLVGETRVLAMEEEEVEETEIEGFSAEESTLFCSNVIGNQFIQITSTAINLIDCYTKKRNDSWKPDTKITSSSVNPTSGQILVAMGPALSYLEITGNKIIPKQTTKLESDISCVNISGLAGHERSFVCAVGMWNDISARIYTLPDFQMVSKELLGGEIIPRSILLISFEDIHYLLVALGDGNLFTFTVDPSSTQLMNRKKISLGTQPLTLSIFNHSAGQHVFVGSDRPTVIYSHNKKLLFSNVNLKEVNFVCSFHSSSFEHSLALSTNEDLTIGAIDDIQKLHIRTIPLGEMARRIAYDPDNRVMLVLTMAITAEGETGWVRLFDSETFELLDSYKLANQEDPISVQLITVPHSKAEDNPNNNNNNNENTPSGNNYFVVGTAFNKDVEPEPSSGRLIVFQVTSHSKLTKYTEHSVNGGVYKIAQFNGRILAGVRTKLQLYDLDESSEALKLVCEHSGFILILMIDVRGDFILIGDLMNSMTLLLYDKIDSKIEELARDVISRWMTAACMLDEEAYIGSDCDYNLVWLKRNTEGNSEEARSQLSLEGQFHAGEFINNISPGSFVMRLPESPYADLKSLIYVTVSGAIGLLAPLPKEDYAFFSQLETHLSKLIKGVGGLQHENWRAFSSPAKTEPATGFIDGDLIERCLDLPSRNIEDLAKSMKLSPEDLLKKIENLQRALH